MTSSLATEQPRWIALRLFAGSRVFVIQNEAIDFESPPR